MTLAQKGAGGGESKDAEHGAAGRRRRGGPQKEFPEGKVSVTFSGGPVPG